jgi:hypothetical protein
MLISSGQVIPRLLEMLIRRRPPFLFCASAPYCARVISASLIAPRADPIPEDPRTGSSLSCPQNPVSAYGARLRPTIARELHPAIRGVAYSLSVTTDDGAVQRRHRHCRVDASGCGEPGILLRSIHVCASRHHSCPASTLRSLSKLLKRLIPRLSIASFRALPAWHTPDSCLLYVC